MASAKIGIIIGIIILIAGIAIISSSYEMNPDESQEITQNTQPDEIEDADTGEYDFYINEDGKKVIVVNTGDSLSIGE